MAGYGGHQLTLVWVHDDSQVRQQVEQRHAGEVKQGTRLRIVAAATALAEDHLGIA